MVENNMITNCDINADDIKRADTIWGPSESVLQGKIKRKKPNTQNTIPKLALPLSVSQQHKQITMYIDIFYVNRISFFLSKIGKIMRVDFLSKLISPPLVETVILSCCLHATMSFTRAVLFDMLLVAHVSSSTHVSLIPELRCVIETPTCVNIAPV